MGGGSQIPKTGPQASSLRSLTLNEDEKAAASQESASFEKNVKLDLSQSSSVEMAGPQQPRAKPGGYKIGEFKVSGSAS